MDDAIRDFDKRANSVRKNHARLARGYVTKINKNGILEHRPRRGGLVAKPLRVLVLLAVALLVFKGFLLAELGVESYTQHLSDLSNGTTAERMGAVLMSIDPITQKFSEAFALFT